MKVEIRQGTIDDVIYVDHQIPEFDARNTKEKLSSKLNGLEHLILIAFENEQPVAYKLGYQRSVTEFYSWLGGVIPNTRKKGIATQLRLTQEQWAKEKGYQSISVKSMNRYPAMLQLLISSGYAISGYEDTGSVESSKIKFQKSMID
ncbi:GNAT family N-acetyltransferase [Aliivibrio sifiae]|uniref:N-acetyltransferase n=1 Tax=Aliivibrio sifiae TaxID=566293 RepID=A0A2S7XIG4_9GAMM|nr:GNAT family N-acetyltransferase [Aliivibrio sifiae]PQJ93383.1 GNAT family N-acetyltransferase [Aliivibrio sifiae]GLR74536.1 N-acetyltransferase [Aliivibrio sifiae]